MPPVPSRQIHLDFHTSEHIPGVGSRFSRRQFQEALQIGQASSMLGEERGEGGIGQRFRLGND